MNKSEQINELAVALAKASGELKNPSFDTQNPFFKSKYASLATVRDTVTPVLAKHGLSVVQLLGKADGGVSCETVLLHSSGQWLSETIYMPSAKQDAQGYGSAATYCRRYALMAICNVVGDEDDDGLAAAKPKGGVTPGSVTPTTGAKEALKPDQVAKVDKVASNMIDMFEAGRDVSEPYNLMELALLDNEERIYLWTWLDSKQRSAIKKYHEAQKGKA